MNVLVAHGANMNDKCHTLGDNFRWIHTPLTWAISGRVDISVLKILLDNGTNVNEKCEITKGKHHAIDTPLTFAIGGKADTRVIKILIENGADMNEKCEHTRDGCKHIHTPLTKAIDVNTGIDVLKMVIENGADVNVPYQKSNKKYYPLMRVIEENVSFDVLALMVEKGAKIDILSHMTTSETGEVYDPMEHAMRQYTQKEELSQLVKWVIAKNKSNCKNYIPLITDQRTEHDCRKVALFLQDEIDFSDKEIALYISLTKAICFNSDSDILEPLLEYSTQETLHTTSSATAGPPK